MRLILLTQNDPFFLTRNLTDFLDTLDPRHSIVACVLMNPSPFGKRSTLVAKVGQALSVFGPRFLWHYATRMVCARLSGTPSVETLLQQRAIPLLRPEGSINTESFLSRLASYKPDLLISIAANQIFRRPLLDLAPKGCINLHTSLLPKYRGLMPSFWVLRNGEVETGVSVFLVDEGIDSGPILVQKRVPINGMSQQELIEHTKELGMKAVQEAISLIDQEHPPFLPNPEDQMSYFHFPTRADVKAFRANGARFF